MRMQWEQFYLPPLQRFYPLTEDAHRYALYAAQEEDVRQELRDRDWPTKYMENEDEDS